MSPGTDGTWTFTLLYSFKSSPDAVGGGSLTMDPAGNIYGTTYSGGVYGDGALYELKQQPAGNWEEKVLVNFTASCIGPNGDLVRDSAGNLYGTCYFGYPAIAGSVFEASPGVGGSWTSTILYNFTDGGDGGFPGSGVILDSAGNLYGTTTQGGTYGGGTVYEITP